MCYPPALAAGGGTAQSLHYVIHNIRFEKKKIRLQKILRVDN